MNRSVLTSAVMLSLLLAACANETKQDNKICVQPPEQASGAWVACLHRMAYKLARSPDPAAVVAKATVAGCAEPMATQINMAKIGERLKLAEDINRSAEDFALYFVVQARAGKCDVP